jgi:hypothetical protein
VHTPKIALGAGGLGGLGGRDGLVMDRRQWKVAEYDLYGIRISVYQTL